MDQKEVIKIAEKYKDLLSQFLEFQKMYLFGSWATGTSRIDSDIDIAVIVEDAGENFFDVNPLLWKIRRQIDDRIEPVLIEKDRDRAGFLDTIRENGIEI